MTIARADLAAPNQGAPPDLLDRMDACWRAANYLPVDQTSLRDNPLLTRPLAADDIKRMLLGHWGTTPGQNFIDVHLNRVICQYGLDMILDPATDGAVLPILHLNGYRISNPTDWLLSYRPNEFFDASGRLRAPLAALAPAGRRVTLLTDKLAQHRRHICQYGEDLPEIGHWQWTPRHARSADD
jgi:phosphoketolase